VALTIKALDGGVLDGSVDALDLAMGSRDVLSWWSDARCRWWRSICEVTARAQPPAPGVVNWMPLSVSTVWIL